MQSEDSRIQTCDIMSHRLCLLDEHKKLPEGDKSGMSVFASTTVS